MNWSEIFDYAEGKIYYKVKRRGCKFPVGHEAWCKSEAIGYKLVMINKKFHLTHRIIWEMHNGEIPEGMEIDHINGVRDDNRIENLRCVTKGENAVNKRMSKRNKSGLTGVCFDKSKGLYKSQISRKGRERSVVYFDNIFDAACHRKSMEISYGFHENHGK